ncbi:G protein-coupled receptor 158a isoform X2 [Denticeps clupeoides]|uniref:G-protein coupled receptors family 3 profile domain-containing protein n=1 Tax=Denticeps clupeoides TaxID=299321 RepID=A0AAY4A2A3_9TELE|nr:probable G-protein coupled receptor 158 isoform X2 [Denticeps clupeoides]
METPLLRLALLLLQAAGLLAASGGPNRRPDERLSRPVAAFLRSGEPSALTHANCSRRYELQTPGGTHGAVRGVLDAVTHAANFLNMVLQANRSRERSLRPDAEWYHALVRSVLEGDARIQRAAVALGPDAGVFLQATREGGEVVLRDHSGGPDAGWFHDFRGKKKGHFQRRVQSHDIESLDASLKAGETFVLDKSHVRWSSPYLECRNGVLLPRWLLTLSAGFYGLKAPSVPDFRGVVRVDVSLQNVDIDQCSSEGWFAGTHGCNLTSMECLPIPGFGFVLDKYKCHCKPGLRHPNRVSVHGRASNKQKDSNDDNAPGSSTHCLPCQEGCTYCQDDTPCVAHDDGYLRLAVLSFQGLCIMGDFVSMVLVYHFRRNKAIRASGLVLLESILFGALLLYFPVVILYFKPGVFRCILIRWVRLLGFATVYGTVTLKLYRVLKVFLSRTAQRIPYMTSWRVLRLLSIILLIVCWFLAAWTSAVCQNPDRTLALIAVGFTPEGLQFSMCLLDSWDYMMAVAEFLFLLWGVYLCYAVRTVPSAFHEPRYMAIAIHNELVLSAVFHIIRFSLAAELHPDWTLMLFFAHVHLTVTVTLGLLLVPKFLFAGTHLRDDIATEAYEDELDMGRSGSYLNSSITSAWSEHSLDPEDIREELKKLYSQLEIYKRKKMLANNPHLQKKRSSKKGLGRSLMRRITEIPETVRQCSREDKDAVDHVTSNHNSICALRKNPFDPSHATKAAKEESLRSKVFSLKKSHSSYDHVRDQSEDSSSSAAEKMELSATEASLLDTLMGKTLIKKKSSEKLNTAGESTESVPLVCKSASAHNLTADKKPLHPRTSMLQKSLSVIASAKEKTLGLTGKTQTAEDTNKKGIQKPKEAETPTESEDESEGFSKMIISQSVEYKQTTTKTGIMKQQVSGSQPSISSEGSKNKDLYNLSEVCPWEVEDLPTPSENRIQKHVSIAPDETTTVHGSSTKGGKTHQNQKSTGHSPSVSRHLNQKPLDQVDICSREDGKETRCHKEKPRPSSYSQSSGETGKTHRADVCSWDYEEVPVRSVDPVDKGRHKKGSSLPEGKGRGKETLCEPVRPSHSLLQSAASKADVCPWDHDSTTQISNSKQAPSSSQTSKTKESTAQVKGNVSTRTLEKETGKERDKPKDTEEERSKPKVKESLLSGKSTAKHTSQAKMAEVCPWDIAGEETLTVEKRHSANVGTAKSKQTDVCPWDFQSTSESKGTDKNSASSLSKQKSSNSKAGAKAKMADVCPWDFEDQTAGKKA